MTETLVIVESATKAKIIAKYLNSIPELVKQYGKFNVVASFGHIIDLKKKELSIDVEHDFKLEFMPIEDKQKLLSELGKKIKNSNFVLLASDADREGASIAYHIKNHYRIKKYKRIVFTEITKNALKKAVLNAGEIDMNLVHAQQARRALDRLVGFKLSPILWKLFKTNGSILSAGRVQSAVLKIIVDKDNEANNFQTTQYWTISGNFSHDIQDAKLYSIKENTIWKTDHQLKLHQTLSIIQSDVSIADTSMKRVIEKPPLPFITSTLQQEAYSKCGFSIAKTMKVAQDLYENGLITYMRTDSTELSQDAIDKIKYHILDKFGTDYYDDSPKHKGGKIKNHSQEAHECIRPTDICKETISLSTTVSKDHIKLYDLIRKRTIASRMTPAIYQELLVTLTQPSLTKQGLHFIGKFKQLVFDGFLRMYDSIQNDTVDFQTKINTFKTLKMVKCLEAFGNNTWKSPPSRYNEGSIIKVLDTEGIGRPATYTSILSKLYEKTYIQKQDIVGIEKPILNYVFNPSTKKMKEQKDAVIIGKENSRIIPTEIGQSINTFLESNFEYIINKSFTSKMEDELDKIAQGKETYQQCMNQFWTCFQKHLQKFNDITSKQKTKLENISKDVVIDKVAYTLRITKYGPVIQYNLNPDKIKYINLRSYLNIVRKDLTDINEKDIKFLIKLPCEIDKKTKLHYGPYGFYLEKDGKNFSISKKYIQKDDPSMLLKMDKDDMRAVLSYKKSQ